MNIPPAPGAYDQTNEQATRSAMSAEDRRNFKKGEDVRLQRGERLIMPDEATGDVYRVYITSGALTVELV